MEKEIELKSIMNEKLNQRKLRENKLIETRTRYETEVDHLKNELTERLEKINERVIVIILTYVMFKQIGRKKAENYKNLVVKYEQRSIEREDKYENVMRYEKAKEYERQKKLEDILEKMKKIDEMK